jgi:hypothetical protein
MVTGDTPGPCRLDPAGAVTQLHALGTTVTLAVDDHRTLAEAEAILREELEAIDRACSRFRSDSEIWSLYAQRRAVQVSPLLYEAVVVALKVAERTEGAVDPTVGLAVEKLGYDRDFADVPAVGPPLDTAPTGAPGWTDTGRSDSHPESTSTWAPRPRPSPPTALPGASLRRPDRVRW